MTDEILVNAAENIREAYKVIADIEDDFWRRNSKNVQETGEYLTRDDPAAAQVRQHYAVCNFLLGVKS